MLTGTAAEKATRRQAQPVPLPETRDAHIPGEAGTWVFILGDMTVFALAFSVYLYYRRQDPALFRREAGRLPMTVGLVNTVLLLVSSLLVVLAIRAVRHGSVALVPKLLAVAIMCGLSFLAVTVTEYVAKAGDGYTPASNDYWMFFFVLTGLHLFHLVVGLILLTVILFFARAGKVGGSRFVFVEGGACFWHMVDLLWLVLFPLLYLVR